MRRGKIWLINLDPTIGAEIRKSRPAVIVNDDAIGILPLKVIVPITEWKEQYAAAPWLVRPREMSRQVVRSSLRFAREGAVMLKTLIAKHWLKVGAIEV